MENILKFLTEYWLVIGGFLGVVWALARWVTKSAIEMNEKIHRLETQNRTMRRDAEIMDVKNEINKVRTEHEAEKLQILKEIERMSTKYIGALDKYEKRWERHSAEHDKLAEKEEFVRKEIYEKLNNMEKQTASIESIIKIMALKQNLSLEAANAV